MQKNISERFSRVEQLTESITTDIERETNDNFKFLIYSELVPQYLIDYVADQSSQDELSGVCVTVKANYAKLNRLKEQGLEILIDPETYRILYPLAAKESICRSLGLPIRTYLPLDLGNELTKRSIVEGVVNAQLLADAVISPYFVISTLEDSVDSMLATTLRYWGDTRKYMTAHDIVKPLLGGLLLSEEVFHNQKITTDLLNHLWGNKYVDGFYLILENTRDGSGPVKNVNLLKNWAMFLDKLKTQGKVVLARADITAFCLLNEGTLAMSAEQSKRRFSIKEKLTSPTPQSGGIKKEDLKLKYLAPSLYDFIEGRELLQLIKESGMQNIIECKCRYCKAMRPFEVEKVRDENSYSRKHCMHNLIKFAKRITNHECIQRQSFVINEFTKSMDLANNIHSKPGLGTDAMRKRLSDYKAIISIVSQTE